MINNVNTTDYNFNNYDERRNSILSTSELLPATQKFTKQTTTTMHVNKLPDKNVVGGNVAGSVVGSGHSLNLIKTPTIQQFVNITQISPKKTKDLKKQEKRDGKIVIEEQERVIVELLPTPPITTATTNAKFLYGGSTISALNSSNATISAKIPDYKQWNFRNLYNNRSAEIDTATKATKTTKTTIAAMQNFNININNNNNNNNYYNYNNYNTKNNIKSAFNERYNAMNTTTNTIGDGDGGVIVKGMLQKSIKMGDNIIGVTKQPIMTTQCVNAASNDVGGVGVGIIGAGLNLGNITAAKIGYPTLPATSSLLATTSSSSSTTITTSTINNAAALLRQRTVDQENAFRRIEDVHNYAKLKHYNYSNDVSSDSNSSGYSHRADDDDDEDNDIDDDDDDDDDGDIDDNIVNVAVDKLEKEPPVVVNYESYLKSQRQKQFAAAAASTKTKIKTNPNANKQKTAKAAKSQQQKIFQRFVEEDDETELDNHVDIETISKEGEVEEEDDDEVDDEIDDDDDDDDDDYDERELRSGHVIQTMPTIKTTATTKTGATRAAGVTTTTTMPDHHARRPMNAFLIFCKRHRAIVKDKYKNLENRAITKILGEWWASLDANDKKCFTNLAKQNKDAFFSANPNFKWYKLPAPPLRTLNTRPSNVERNLELEENDPTTFTTSTTPTATAIVQQQQQHHHKGDNFFKLADEAQMGDLSSFWNKQKTKQQQQQCCPLQQALGETTQFLSAHMPQTTAAAATTTTTAAQLDDHEIDGINVKRRRLNHDNSMSSNSSEDSGGSNGIGGGSFGVDGSGGDGVTIPKKSSRSCKGKRYQELVNSGQISAMAKKIKTSTSNKMQDNNNSEIVSQQPQQQHQPQQQQHPTVAQKILNNYVATAVVNIPACKRRQRTISEFVGNQQQFHDDLSSFDLEEKIKELPALCLDTYLQRKRCTKKKRKFSTKKRNSNSTSSSKGSPMMLAAVHSPASPVMPASPTTPTQITPTTPNNQTTTPTTPNNQTATTGNKMAKTQQQQIATTAVGSQKRKARKESITRRDLSAIENEVAEIIPLSTDIAGNYYYNETAITKVPNATILATTTITSSTTTIATTTTSTKSSPQQQFVQQLNNTNFSVVNNHINIVAPISITTTTTPTPSVHTIAATTSDLLILAEVATGLSN